jgi:hypothetical protein
MKFSHGFSILRSKCHKEKKKTLILFHI